LEKTNNDRRGSGKKKTGEIHRENRGVRKNEGELENSQTSKQKAGELELKKIDRTYNRVTMRMKRTSGFLTVMEWPQLVPW